MEVSGWFHTSATPIINFQLKRQYKNFILFGECMNGTELILTEE
jgi:hypothetical protein